MAELARAPLLAPLMHVYRVCLLLLSCFFFSVFSCCPPFRKVTFVKISFSLKCSFRGLSYFHFFGLFSSIFLNLSLILFLQETHQQLADRTGLNVVELRPECGMRPVIVASPREGAQNKILKKRSDKAEYDLNEVFDPYRGLHRPKKVQDLF